MSEKSTLKERLEYRKNVCLFDNTLMARVFDDDTECAQLLVNIILDRDDIIVKEVHTEYPIQNLLGRSVRIDIAALGSDGTRYSIEVQRRKSGAGPKRARYISSIVDANAEPSGDETDKDLPGLPVNYVIFITERDVFGFNLPIYHIDRMITETQTVFEDQSHIIYVNGDVRDDTALGKLMHDFFCTQTADMYYETLSKRAEIWKRITEKEENGVDDNDTLLQKILEKERAISKSEGRAEGKAEGRAEGKAEGRAEGKAEGRAEGKAEGKAEGRAEGIAEGKAEGKAEGMAEGIEKGKYEVARQIMKIRNFSIDEAMDYLMYTPTERERCLGYWRAAQ